MLLCAELVFGDCWIVHWFPSHRSIRDCCTLPLKYEATAQHDAADTQSTPSSVLFCGATALAEAEMPQVVPSQRSTNDCWTPALLWNPTAQQPATPARQFTPNR